MADFPYFPFYPRDYIADTQHLTTEQHGAYLLLLAQMWLRKDCTLPADDEFLSRVAKVSRRRWPSIWEAIGGFFSPDGDQIFQKRLSTERKNVSVFSKKAAQAANTRWLKEKEKDYANASSGQCPSDANQRQKQRHKEDNPLLSPTGDDKPIQKMNGVKTHFAEFWIAYPKKVGKAAAERSFVRQAKKVSHAEIIAGLDRANRHWQTENTDPQFIPNPATWLNQGRWDDIYTSRAGIDEPSNADIERMKREMGF